MPRAKKAPTKPTQPVAPVAAQPPAPPAPTQSVVPANGAAPAKPKRPVLYPSLKITERSTLSPLGPVTVEYARMALGWETEKEFQVRKVTENPGTKPEQYLFGDGVAAQDGTIRAVHCRNIMGEKVVCWNNANNRDFDEKWCEEIIDMILHGQWAGPHTISEVTEEVYGGSQPYTLPDDTVIQPGDTIRLVTGTVNGETIRISRYGDVLSGQHSLTALEMADEKLHKARRELGVDAANLLYPAWAQHNHCFLETITIRGLSNDPRVLDTVDYVKPRSVADMFYSRGTFRSATQTQRKELCRMLAVATDFLWTRTDTRGYRTHPEVVAFLGRHTKLLDCVQHIFQENGARGKGSDMRISKLRLSPGQCAAMMFLMGCDGRKTDGDAYRNEEPAPSERSLDWSAWQKAEDFWVELASAIAFRPVRQALGRLVDSTPDNATNEGQGGRNPEKLAIIAKAWAHYKEHPDSAGDAFTEADLGPKGLLTLTYSSLDDKGKTLPNGQIKLVDVADFGGIDCPQVTGAPRRETEPPDDFVPSPEERERAQAEALARRVATAK